MLKCYGMSRVIQEALLRDAERDMILEDAQPTGYSGLPDPASTESLEPELSAAALQHQDTLEYTRVDTPVDSPDQGSGGKLVPFPDPNPSITEPASEVAPRQASQHAPMLVEAPNAAEFEEPLHAELQELLDMEVQEPLDAEVQKPLDAEVQEPVHAEVQKPLNAEVQDAKPQATASWNP